MVIEGLARDAEGGGGEADAAVFEERVEAYGLREQLVEVAGPGVGDEGAEAGGPEFVDAAGAAQGGGPVELHEVRDFVAALGQRGE